MADLLGVSRRRNSLPSAMGASAPSSARRQAPSAHNVFRIPSNIDVCLGLQWEFIGDDPVDLDASCVAFDDVGNCLEAVFFNNLVAEKEYMVHTGDNTTGEDNGDDDETIIIHMNMIPKEVHYLMVCVTSYTGANFSLVESAHVRLVNLATKEVVGAFSLAVVGHHTASLLCAVSRVAPRHGDDHNNPDGITWWEMREINIASAGFTFCDLLPAMLKLLSVNPNDYEARLAKLPDYSLEKIDDSADMILSQVKFGLGWDGENDLDASLVMLDAQGKYVDHVYAKFGKLKSYTSAPTAAELMARVAAGNLAIAAGGAPPGAPGAASKGAKKPAVVHSGDKLNGFDVEGDDEFIEVDLMNLPQAAAVVYFIAELYDGFATHLNEVPRAYVRLLNKSSPVDRLHKEIHRFALKDIAESTTAYIPYALVRKDNAHWELVHVQESLEGRDWVDVFPFLRAFTKLHVDHTAWKLWKMDVYPFAVKVEIHAVRNLGPLEPQQFACQCWAWVCDKRWQPGCRFRSSIQRDRENLTWNDESHSFVVDKRDILRIMVFETAVVGYADIAMASFFVPEGTGSEDTSHVVSRAGTLTGAERQTNGARGATNADQHQQMVMSDVEMVEVTGGPETFPPATGSNGSTPAAAAPTSATNVKNKSKRDSDPAIGAAAASSRPPLGPSSSAVAVKDDANAQRTSPIHSPPSRTVLVKQEGEALLDHVWLPLHGVDVTGEVCVSLSRIDVPRNPNDEASTRRSWCVVS